MGKNMLNIRTDWSFCDCQSAGLSVERIEGSQGINHRNLANKLFPPVV